MATQNQIPEELDYGISTTSRLLVMGTLVLFIIGGVLAVVGIGYNSQQKMYGGIVIIVIGVSMYTLTIMFTSIRGPPTGFELKGFEAVAKVKPATFRPALLSRLFYLIAAILFSSGCVLVIIGFNRGVYYLWIPGYAMSLFGFLAYTLTIMYGPMNVKPGAMVVAFPDDNLNRVIAGELEDAVGPRMGIITPGENGASFAPTLIGYEPLTPRGRQAYLPEQGIDVVPMANVARPAGRNVLPYPVRQ
ncbi:uncharacterized protein LOC135399873 isoform X2 [Ornithodoros turicata]